MDRTILLALASYKDHLQRDLKQDEDTLKWFLVSRCLNTTHSFISYYLFNRD